MKFEGDGAEVLVARVPAARVVEAVDVGRDGIVRLGACREVLSHHALLLERREEALDGAVVITVAGAAHALRDLVAGEDLAVRAARVLAAAV